MRKFVLLYASLAWIPAGGNAAWGQSAPQGRKDTNVERQERQKQTTEAKTEEQYHRGVDRWTLIWNGTTAIATALLVLVGVGGVGAAIYTLREIRAQTAITKSNTEILINSERAWVTIRPLQTVLMPITPGAVPPYNTFRFTITNRGKTVARLMTFQSAAFLAKRDIVLPDTPHYEPHQATTLGAVAETIEVQHAGVFAPGDPAEMAIGINTFLNRENIEQITDGEWVFYVFGRIDYFDFAKEQRTVQFCYQYARSTDFDGNPIYWRLAGPPAYNTHI